MTTALVFAGIAAVVLAILVLDLRSARRMRRALGTDQVVGDRGARRLAGRTHPRVANDGAAPTSPHQGPATGPLG